MPSELILAFVLLASGGPVLMFPELLPLALRTSVVTLVTFAAVGLGLAMLRPWKGLRLGLWLFLLAVLASWVVMPAHDLTSARHFAGIGVGILAMAIVATWCESSDRLITGTLLFAILAICVLTAGLVGTEINRWYYSPKFIGGTWLFPGQHLSWLPEIKLRLPGLEPNGLVNPNALAGTAVMLLPTCVGVTVAAFMDRRRHCFPLLAGIVATSVAMVVLEVTLSRTALLATLMTLATLGLRWRRGRWWILLIVLLSAGGLAYEAFQLRTTTPGDFDKGIVFVRNSVLARVEIWQGGIRLLQKAPWLGVGINQFHEFPNAAIDGGTTHVAHAHNILLQVALDVGVPGLFGYVLFIGALVITADRTARTPGVAGRIAAGAGLSLVAVHMFGIGDAIALGAKVGVFEWLSAGLILAASHLPSLAPGAFNQDSENLRAVLTVPLVAHPPRAVDTADSGPG